MRKSVLTRYGQLQQLSEHEMEADRCDNEARAYSPTNISADAPWVGRVSGSVVLRALIDPGLDQFDLLRFEPSRWFARSHTPRHRNRRVRFVFHQSQ